MEGLQYRPTIVRDSNMDELLSNGYWKSSRAKAQSSTNRPHPSIPRVFTDSHNHNTPRRPTVSRTPHHRNYRKPVCEDELESLSREVDSARSSAISLLDHEPPARGTIDQHPVLLEADSSTADALKYEKQSREQEAWEQGKKAPQAEGNEERRFVFIPRDTTYSPFVELQSGNGAKQPDTKSNALPKERGARCEERPSEKGNRRTSRERRESRERKEIREENYNRSPEQSKRPENMRTQTLDAKPPSIPRQRSRQDLPTLKTQIHQDSPPFHRSVSDFAFSSQSPERRRRETSRPQNGEYLLSPEIPPSGRSASKGYFDNVPRQFPRPEDPLATRQVLPEKRDGNSNMLNPKSATFPREKPSQSAEDRPSARRYSNQKMPRPQMVPEEHSRHSSYRDSSPLPRKYQVEPIDHPPTLSRSSNHSGDALYYVSSEDESLTDDDPVVHRQHDREHDRHPEHRRHHHRRHHSHSSKHLEADHENGRHRRSASKTNHKPLEVKPGSRVISPLPSPNGSPPQVPFDLRGHDSLPTSRDSKKDPSRSTPLNIISMLAAAYASGHAPEGKPHTDRPRSRHSSPGSESLNSPRSSNHSLSIPMPVRAGMRPSAEAPSSPIFDESDRKTPMPRSPGRTPQQVDESGNPFWQPPPFHPEDNPLHRPVGTYRRYSEDTDRGAIPRLPNCPRTNPVAGKKDWLTLPGCPSFDICPSCYKSAMSETEFANHFVASPRRPDHEKVLCAFGSCTWYRFALLLTLKEERKDLRMFKNISKINETVLPCLGPHEATRTWHSIIDPANNKPVDGFNVCPSCVQSIETVLPPLKGVFVRKSLYSSDKNPAQKKRICDMRFDSPRFVKYFNTLEHTADIAVSNFMPPNITDLVSLARRYAAVDECSPGKVLYDAKWHYITQLPEFTVCPECFEDVVRPARRAGLPIPKMFGRDPRRVEIAMCHLGGPEAKAWFEGLVGRAGDFSGFARAAREKLGRTERMNYVTGR